MARILVLTADIPYFPGKMGVDFFNVRYLAQHHHVGVVGPIHECYPQAGVENLRRTVQAPYLWPDSRPDLVPNLPTGQGLRLPGWVARLPRSLRRWLLHGLLGLRRWDHDGLTKLALLSQLAPYLLAALADHHWDVLIVMQSDTRPWLDYLPRHLAVAVYFHDVRSHYLAQRARFEADRRSFQRQARLARQQEREIARSVDAVGFVSELDLRRAEKAFGPLPEARVAPIPVDLDYFVPRPPGFVRDGSQVVLFTGHLAHPPNVDAVLYFLREVWPRVRARHPQAVFHLAGTSPLDALRAACRAAPGVELHADVPDIRPLFWNADVYVVPMRFGGGVRQKILEAWAMEVPVVLTPMAGEGCAVRHAVNCFVAEGAAMLAAQVGDLLERPAAASAVVRRAREEVGGRHAIELASPAFEQLALAAVAAHRRRPLRVLLDLSWLQPADTSPTAELARGLAAALTRVDLAHHYLILAPKATLRGLRLAERVRGLALDGWRLRSQRLRHALGALLAESLHTHQPMGAAMRRLELLRLFDADLLHSFDPQRPTVGTLLPTVVGPLGGVQRLAQLGEGWGQLAQRVCRGARRVVCGTEEERRWLHEDWGVAPGRLVVVPVPAGSGRAARPAEWDAFARAMAETYDRAREG